MVDLAPRDIVSRAIYLEIRDGCGVDGKDYVYLDVRHLGRAVIEEKLPDITDFARVYLGVEPLTEPVPIQPTAHYAMGGVPTDLETRVTRDEKGTVVPGLGGAGGDRRRAQARAGRRDDGQRGGLPRRDPPGRGPGEGPRAARPLREHLGRRQGPHLQHRPPRGPRAGLPPRLRRDDP